MRDALRSQSRARWYRPNVSDIDEQGRPEPPFEADEVTTALGFLEFQRATMAWKTAGLDARGFATTVAASTVTLGGMLKHLAFVEEYWFCERFAGQDQSLPWSAVDWDADADWDWHSAANDTPEQVVTLWEKSVRDARAVVTAALLEGGLDQRVRWAFPDGRGPSLRWIVLHMIEEYARHNGHADLIRESIDGQTGE